MILSAIAAMASNRVIGKNGKLPWHLPEDLKFLKETTKGRVLIIGRKTFESLPKPLPGRFHIIVTRQKNYQVPTSETFTKKDFVVVHSVTEAVEFARELLKPSHPLFRDSFGEEVFIMGGSEIYQELMDKTDRIYLTVIEKSFEGDAKFPDFEKYHFQEVNRINRDEPMKFSIRTYERA